MFDNITYRLLRLFIRMVSCVPLPVAQFTGRWFGNLAFLLPMSRKAVALDNLIQSFGPEMNTERQSDSSGKSTSTLVRCSLKSRTP